MSMLPEKLAPIVISIYTRLDHFKKCILSLQENDLACESELFIYSDAASSLLDIEGVTLEQVGLYLLSQPQGVALIMCIRE